ncbi:hypothetical protein D3C80_1499350 [compost metagenome]
MPAFGQVLTPFGQRTGEAGAVIIHRGIIRIIVGQTQVIHLIRQLIQLEDDAVEIDLCDSRKAAHVFVQRTTHVNQARIVHICQAGIGTFQQRSSGGHILIAP